MTNSRPSRPRQSRTSRSYSTGRGDSDRDCVKRVNEYLELGISDAKRKRERATDKTEFQYQNGRVNGLREAQLDLIPRGSRVPSKHVLGKRSKETKELDKYPTTFSS